MTTLAITIRCSLMTLMIFSAGLTVRSQWREVPLPTPYDQGYYLDVFFLPSNPNFGWACSIQGFVVRTTDAGRTWTGSAIRDANLEYIQFLSPSVGYCSGPSGVYRSTDGGRSWVNRTPALVVDEKGWGSYWLSETEGVYFVGGCATGRQYFYRTTDAGVTWAVSVTNEPNSGLSDGIIYADGTGYAISSGILWGTNDAGRNWFRINTTGSRRWTEEIAVAGRSILLPTSGTDCDGQTRGVGSLRFSTDGGRSWREFQTGSNMFGAFLVSESTGWGVGDNRAVYQTTDYGRTWTQRNCGIRENIDDVWFVNDTVGWAVGNGIYRSFLAANPARVTIYPEDRVASICRGDTMFVEARGPFTTYEWTDGTRAAARQIAAPGEYIVRAYDSLRCEYVSDTITIRLRSTFTPTITSSSKSLCDGDTMLLQVQGPVRSWRWSTGDTTEGIRVASSGRITCQIIDTAGCAAQALFDVIVFPLPKPQVATDRSTTICLDQQVVLSADSGFRSYRWSNGATTRSITTSSAGRYSVRVIDANGCSGESGEVEVIVLNARNRAEFQFSSTDRTYTIVEHEVGELRCQRLRIRNTSDTSALVIRDMRFAGNVYFSVPKAQFPLIIAPSAFGEMTICASAIDTGLVVDTLLYDDTCSTIGVPVRTQGMPIQFLGIGQCEIPISATVIRAGSAWQLRAPFPIPARDRLRFSVDHRGQETGRAMITIVDVTGRTMLPPEVVSGLGMIDVELDITPLDIGPYQLVLSVDGEPHSSISFLVHR